MRLSGPTLVVFVLAVVPAAAQTATATLSANLGGLAKLSFSTNSISFPDANPDIVPLVPASPGPIVITAKTRSAAGGTVTLTVQASDVLRSGLDTIPASAITWTTSGPGYVAGTLSSTAPQLVGSWTGSGVHIGTQNYLLHNLWTYPTGTYSVSLLYTLSSQ